MKINLSDIINKAYKITLKNKWLWIFGILLATSSTSFQGLNNLGKLSDLGNQTKQNSVTKPGVYNAPNSKPTPTTRNVLGIQAPSTLETLSPAKSLLSSINIVSWVLIGIAVLALVIVGMGIAISARSWAEGALINGIQQENAGTVATLAQMSLSGRSKFKDMLKLNLLYFVLTIPVALLGGLLAVLGTLAPMSLLFVIPIGLLLALVFIIIGIAMMLIIEIAKLAVALENMGWKEAFNVGKTITQKFLADIIVLNIVNCLIGTLASVASCFVVLIFIAIIAAAALPTVAIPPLAVITAPFIFLVVLVLITASSVFSGILAVFNKATWVLFYEQVKGLSLEVQNAA